MRHSVLRLIAFLGMGMMAACGLAGGDNFRAGTWELEGWMENEGDPQRISLQTHEAKVSDQLAAMGARTTAFSEFYHGSDPRNVTFANGEISGHINQGAVAPFPEHTQEVTGWYTAEEFELRIKLPKIGPYQPYQIVRGKWVGE